uniref:RAWUL domain-containing protein n=1 Tax=Romanomermis culicivorax TaxID=13658 RepID=A0A915I092_ROMCU
METAHDVISVAKQTRYLKTTANATVDHLAKFLVTRIKLDRDEATRSSSGASFSSFIDKNSENSTRNDENTVLRIFVEELVEVHSPKFRLQFFFKSPRFSHSLLVSMQSFLCPAKPKLPNSVDNGVIDARPKTQDICKLYVMRGGGTPLLNTTLHGLTELDGDSTLDYVLTKMWCIKKPLEMYFSLTEEVINDAIPPLITTTTAATAVKKSKETP